MSNTQPPLSSGCVRLLSFVVPLLSVCVPTGMWLRELRKFPGDSLADNLLFLRADAQYFVIYSNLLRGGAMTPGTPPDGTQFPLLAVLPHSLGTLLLGAWAFPILEGLFAFVRCFLYYRLFRSLQTGPISAWLAILCLESPVLSFAARHLGVPHEVLGPFFFLHTPNPQVMFCYFQLALIAGVQLLGPGVHAWHLAALSLALLINSNLYFFWLSVWILIPLGIFRLLHSPARKEELLAAGRALALFAVGCLPFAYQSFWKANPEVPLRYGVYLARLESFPILPILAISTVVFLPTRFLGPVPRIVAAWCLAAGFGKTLLRYFSERSIQDFHFDQLLAAVASLAAVSLLCWLVPKARKLSWALGGLIPLFAMILTVSFFVRRESFDPYAFRHTPYYPYDHPRKDALKSETPSGYRNSFRELMALLRERHPDYRTLLSFDPSLVDHQVAFFGKKSLLADPFMSSLSDAQIEERLLRGLKIAGARPGSLRDFLLQPTSSPWPDTVSYLSVFWLGHMKFQYSEEFALFPKTAYTEQIQRSFPIKGGYPLPFSSIPLSEIARMEKRFSELPVDDSELPDLIVLMKNSVESPLGPNPSTYRAELENESFRLFSRR